MVIGRVVGVHIEDRVLTDGAVDVSKTQPIGRLGPNQVRSQLSFDLQRLLLTSSVLPAVRRRQGVLQDGRSRQRQQAFQSGGQGGCALESEKKNFLLHLTLGR